MVQIAAVRNRPDAEALAAALRKNGFSPSIRSESQDKFLHVQVGPFASRDEAKAMRQKLTSAGYDAFIK
jgi:cell division septation protein DedD